jgi:hypothetical protein
MKIMDTLEFISSMVLMALCTWAIIALGKEVYRYMSLIDGSDLQNTIANALLAVQLAKSILLCVLGWTQFGIVHNLNKEVIKEEEERV